MKKTLKILSLFILMIIIATNCFATNEVLNTTSTEENPELISTEDLEEADSDANLSDEEINNEEINNNDLLTANPYDYQYGDIYAFDGSRLSENTVVYGNVYIMGNDINLTFTAIVGNLYIMGNNITISAQEVTGNIYVLGNDVKINCGIVDNAIYAMANAIELNVQTYHLYGIAEKITISENSQVGVDARLSGNEVNFKGGVGNNLYTDCENLYLDDNCMIYGSVEYTNNISAPEALQSKLVKKEGVKVEKISGTIEELSNGLKSFSLVFSIVFSIVTVILITLAMRKSDKYETDLKNHFLQDIALGLVAMIGMCLASVLLMITVLGVVAGLVMLLAWILLLIIAIPIATVEFAKLILGDRAVSKAKVAILAIGLNVVILILNNIPVAGTIINSICLLYGFGFSIRKIFGKKGSNENKDRVVAVDNTDKQDDIVKAIDEIEPEVIKEEEALQTPVVTDEENNLEENKEEKEEKNEE